MALTPCPRLTRAGTSLLSLLPGIAGRQCRVQPRTQHTLARMRGYAGARAAHHVADSLLRKVRGKALRQAARLQPLEAGSPSRTPHDRFPADTIRRLDVSLLGGNLTLVVDPARAHGTVAVASQDEAKFRPSVHLAGDTLTVRHRHNVLAYAGQVAPVHTTLWLPFLPRRSYLRMVAGEVWVFGSGIPAPGSSGSGGNTACNQTEQGDGPCWMDIDCGLGDVQLFDVLGRVTTKCLAGDTTVAWTEASAQSQGIDESALNTWAGLGDLRVLAHCDIPLAGVACNGKNVQPLHAYGAAAQPSTAGSGVRVTSSSWLGLGDAHLVRFADDMFNR